MSMYDELLNVCKRLDKVCEDMKSLVKECEKWSPCDEGCPFCEQEEEELINQRRCSMCKALMVEGYYFECGEYDYLCDECRPKQYSDAEMEEIYKNDDGYWTSWEGCDE